MKDHISSFSLMTKPVRTIVEQAMNELRAKMGALEAIAHLSKADWDLDQDRGTIVFKLPTGITASASAQIIGTFNRGDKTWLWAWGPSVHRGAAPTGRQGRFGAWPQI